MSSLIELEKSSSLSSRYEPLLKGHHHHVRADINGKQIRDLVEESIRQIYIPELNQLEYELCKSDADIIAIASDYSGKYVILGLASQKIEIRDLKTHNIVCQIEGTGLIHQLFFIEEMEMLYYYTYDACFYQAKAEFDNQLCGLPQMIYEKKEALYCVIEGTKLFAIAFSETNELKIYDTNNHKCEKLGTFESEPIQMCSTPDQQLIFLLCANRDFYIWSLKRGEIILEISFEELPINFTANDTRVVLQYKRALALLDLENNKFIKEIECNSNLFVFNKIFHSSYLMIDMPKGRIVMLKMEDLEEECTLYKPQPEEEQLSCVQRVAQSGNLKYIYLVKDYRTVIKLVTAKTDTENSTIHKIDGQINHIQLFEGGFSFTTSKGELYEAKDESSECMGVKEVELEKGAPTIFLRRMDQATGASQYYTFTKEEQDDQKEDQRERFSHLGMKYPRGLNYLRYEKTKTKRNSWLDSRQFQRQSFIFGKCSIQPKTIEIECKQNVRAMAITPDQKFMVIGTESGEIRLFDYQNQKYLGIFGWHAGKVKNLVIASQENKCFSSSSDGTIGVWDIPLPKGRMLQDELPKSADNFLKGCPAHFRRNFKKQLKIQIRENHTVHTGKNIVFQPELKDLLQINSLSITWIELTPDQKYLIAGASSGHVLQWSVFGKCFQRVIGKHRQTVKRVILSADRRSMITYDSGAVFIIDLTYEPRLSGKLIFHQSVNIQAALFIESGFVIIDMRGNVDFISLKFENLKIRVSQAFPVCFPISYQANTRLGRDGSLCMMELFYSPSGKVEYFPSTFKKYGFKRDFCPWKRQLFLFKMKHESLTKNIKYFRGFETFLTQFSQFSMLHLYAFFSQIDLIKEALLTTPILPESSLGISPLRVSLAINDMKAVSVFVNYLVTNQDILHFNDWGFLEKDLIELNKVKYRNIHLIYQNLGTVPSLELPDSGDLKGEDQLVILLDSEQLNQPIKVQQGNANRLDWRLSLIPFEFAIGSSESVEFLTSMKNSRNLQIFKSPFIQAYIQQKWLKIRKTIALSAFVHAIFIAFLLQTILVGRL